MSRWLGALARAWFGFFAIAGGLVLSLLLLQALHPYLKAPVGAFGVAVIAVAAGCAAGGFIAGWACGGRGWLAPGAAGLVVGVGVVAVFYSGDFGQATAQWFPRAFAYSSIAIAATAVTAGSVGTLLGRWSSDGAAYARWAWVVVSLWMTGGFLLVAILSVPFATGDEAGSASEDVIWAAALLISLGTGFTVQAAARRRHLLVSSVGPALVLGGLIPVLSFDEVSLKVVGYASTLFFGAWAVALVGASVAYAVGRVLRRWSRR